MRATWPAQLIFFDLITRTIFGEQHIPWRSSWCSVLSLAPSQHPLPSTWQPQKPTSRITVSYFSTVHTVRHVLRCSLFTICPACFTHIVPKIRKSHVAVRALPRTKYDSLAHFRNMKLAWWLLVNNSYAKCYEKPTNISVPNTRSQDGRTRSPHKTLFLLLRQTSLHVALLHTVYLCAPYVWLTVNDMTFLHNIHRLFFLMEADWVLCEVRAGFLYIIWINFNLQ